MLISTDVHLDFWTYNITIERLILRNSRNCCCSPKISFL